MNRSPYARTFEIDIRKETPTMADVCARLKQKYAGNQFALAQVALFDPGDEIHSLHSDSVKRAIEGKLDEALATNARLKEKLLLRFPDLNSLPDDAVQRLIDYAGYR